jgi:glycosyltransferase involved in cell wall biosynthesis
MQKNFPEDFALEELPMVTVLMANHNYEEYLRTALESAAGQNYPKLGIVLVDDASTDDSWKTIHDIVFKGSPHENRENDIGYYKTGMYNNRPICAIQLKENYGPSQARNFGIEATLSHTDAYVVLDIDDVMYPHKVSRLTSCMMQSPQIGVVYADNDQVNTVTGAKTTEYREPFSYDRLVQECIVHSGSLISKQALEGVQDQFGYYDRNMRTCEDYDLWLRIGKKFMICHIAESLTLVRIQPRNSTLTVDKAIWEQNWNRIRQKMQVQNG